jgi:transcriptional regulator with XRE-family HTH domain
MSKDDIVTIIATLIERGVIVPRSYNDTGIKAFAEMIGVSRQTASYWASGHAAPRPTHTRRIRQFLDELEIEL